MVAREQPCLVVGDFNVEPTKIPCLAKGISAGLWVDPDGILLVGPGGISWLAALVLLLRCQGTWLGKMGGFFLTWLFVHILSIHCGFLGFLSRFSARLFGRKFKGYGESMMLGCNY